MKLSAKDQVWNRAALEAGGINPRAGDVALSSALRIHGLVMNGGVHHAVQASSKSDLEAAEGGFEYFDLGAISHLLRRVRSDPTMRQWTDATEEEANRQYWAVLPDDAVLVSRFEARYKSHPQEFSEVVRLRAV